MKTKITKNNATMIYVDEFSNSDRLYTGNRYGVVLRANKIITEEKAQEIVDYYINFKELSEFVKIWRKGWICN